jgi:hypothetical protein
MRTPDRTRRSTIAALGAAAAAGYAALHWLGRTAGSTRSERRRVVPGDELVVEPTFVTNHATTVAAPPERIWPWLQQMGWHRGGWYTARWVDRMLFPGNLPSADRILPELQALAVGNRIPDGAPETGCEFVVEALEPHRHLVLHSRTHLPPGWADRFGAAIDWTWAFVLEPMGPERTRFLFRSRARLAPGLVAAMYWLVIVPADFVMARQMLRGVRARATGRPT